MPRFITIATKAVSLMFTDIVYILVSGQLLL